MDFFQYRELTEAKRKPVKRKPVKKKPVMRNGEDYTDHDLRDSWGNAPEQMKTQIKIAEIKKISKASAAKMSADEKQKLYDILQDDYEVLDNLAVVYGGEAENQENYLYDVEPSERKYVKQEIKYHRDMEKKIRKHMDLILKHEQFL